MKKIATLFLAVLTCFALAACSGGNGGNASGEKLDMSLSEIMTSIYDGVETVMVGETELNAENFQSFAFIEYKEGYEGLASEAMIGSQAHSVVLVRVPEGEDVAAVAEQIKTNADPRKWICVEAEKTEVVTKGDVILLCMSFADTTDAIVANFEALS